MTGHFNLLALTAVFFLGSCMTLPSGPSVTVLPGTDKTFGQFRGDDAECRQFANEQVSGVTPTQAANESVLKSAAVGTVVGAAAGAALGGDHHDGAAVGAGSGLLIGAAAGSSAGLTSASAVQQRYNSTYVQCMYTKGNWVPVSGRLIGIPPPGSHPPPPPGSHPPPPPGSHPPPPPASDTDADEGHGYDHSH